MSKALVIIDMLNDFVDKGGSLYVQGAETLVPNINTLIEWAESKEIPVVFVCDNHDEDDIEFKVWPKHAIRNTYGSQIFKEININILKHRFVYKQDLSAFSEPSTEKMLNTLKVSELYITGVATDYCIVNATLDSISKHGKLVYGAISRGHNVNIVVDAITGVDEIPGVPKTKGKVAGSLINMGRAGVNAVYTEDVINDY